MIKFNIIIQAIKTYIQWIRAKIIEKKSINKNRWLLSAIENANIRFIISDIQLEQAQPFGLMIGRSDKISELVIDNHTISRCHARITYKHNQVYIEDMNSFYGTKLNDVNLIPFKPIKLNSESILTLGKLKFLYEKT